MDKLIADISDKSCTQPRLNMELAATTYAAINSQIYLACHKQGLVSRQQVG
jgi:hypothetical protein